MVQQDEPDKAAETETETETATAIVTEYRNGGSDTERETKHATDEQDSIARDRAMLSRMYDESFSVAESSETESPAANGNGNGKADDNGNDLQATAEEQMQEAEEGENEDEDETMSLDDLNKDASQEKQVRPQEASENALLSNNDADD